MKKIAWVMIPMVIMALFAWTGKASAGDSGGFCRSDVPHTPSEPTCP